VSTDRATVRLVPWTDDDYSPSNGICRKLVFELLGATQFEYPKRHWLQCNDRSLSLR